jgi:hypothetical protein
LDATKAVQLLERAEAADALQNQHENYRHYPPWIELDRKLQERMTAVGAFVAEISPDLEKQVHRNSWRRGLPTNDVRPALDGLRSGGRRGEYRAGVGRVVRLLRPAAS